MDKNFTKILINRIKILVVYLKYILKDDVFVVYNRGV